MITKYNLLSIYHVTSLFQALYMHKRLSSPDPLQVSCCDDYCIYHLLILPTLSTSPVPSSGSDVENTAVRRQRRPLLSTASILHPARRDWKHLIKGKCCEGESTRG